MSKESKKLRAKTVLNSKKSFSEEEKLVHVPTYPKILQKKKIPNKQSNKKIKQYLKVNRKIYKVQ